MTCRFSLRSDFDELKTQFAFRGGAVSKARYNIGPNAPVPVMVGERRDLYFMDWALKPSWVDHATAEGRYQLPLKNLIEKKIWQKLWNKQRALMLVDGFYLWRTIGEKRRPFYVARKDDKAFAIAALWSGVAKINLPHDASCAVIVQSPPKIFADFQDNFPIIINPENYDAWLAAKKLPEIMIEKISDNFSIDLYKVFPVSPKVNSTSFDAPACVAPLVE